MPRHGCVVAAILLAIATGEVGAQSEARSLRLGAATRTYVIHRPVRAAVAPRPLVLVLHGAGGTGRQIARHTGFDRIADREGFLAVYPDGIDRRWNDGRKLSGSDDVGFIRALVDTVRREFRIDSARIFVTGISNGAMLAHRLACDLPGTFAAIAPVAGALPASLVERCSRSTVSMIAFQGTADRLVPFEGGNVARARGAVLSARATAEHWARAGGCRTDPIVRPLPDRMRDGTRIQRFIYPGCARVAVELYAIIGGGHTWPGGPVSGGRTTREISAAEVMWSFFERSP